MFCVYIYFCIYISAAEGVVVVTQPLASVQVYARSYLV